MFGLLLLPLSLTSTNLDSLLFLSRVCAFSPQHFCLASFTDISFCQFTKPFEQSHTVLTSLFSVGLFPRCGRDIFSSAVHLVPLSNQKKKKRKKYLISYPSCLYRVARRKILTSSFILLFSSTRAYPGHTSHEYDTESKKLHPPRETGANSNSPCRTHHKCFSHTRRTPKTTARPIWCGFRKAGRH